MNPHAAARQLVALADQEQPQVVELACLAAFSVRVDPPLLRRLRLELMPGSTPALEADLWLGDLVSFRGPEGFVFAPGVGSVLRERLATRAPALYEEAWELTQQAHLALSPMLHLEEELNYLQFSRAPDAYARARERLRSAVAAILQSNTPDLARWAVGATTRFPVELMELEEGRMLAVAARTRLRGSLLPLEAPPGPIPEWMSWLAMEGLERTQFGVHLFRDQLELGPAKKSGERVIEVPRTTPLVVEVADPSEDDAPATQRQVFISHARADNALAQRLSAELRTAGYPVVLAEDTSSDLVKQAIANSGAAIVLVSEAAFRSPWVDHEMDYFLQKKQQEGEKFILLPVYLNRSLLQRSMELSRFLAIVAEPDEAPHQLVERIIAPLRKGLEQTVRPERERTWQRVELQPPFPFLLPVQSGQIRLRTLTGDEFVIIPSDPTALLRLPPPEKDLVGYEREVQMVLKKIQEGERTTIIQGPTGAGKTQFALRLAAQVASNYPDAILYIEERPGMPPLTARAVARMVLRALRPEAPSRSEDVLDDCHELLSSRRVLLVVDGLNILAYKHGPPSFLALLPEAGSLLILVTRHEPPWPEPYWVELDGLDPASAVTLLSQLAPKATEHAHAIARACRYLPGPLRQIGKALEHRPPDLPVPRYIELLEQALLLNSFPETFTLEAAREVLADEDEAPVPQQVRTEEDDAQQMLRAGLVMATARPERFSLWRPVRQIAEAHHAPLPYLAEWRRANHFAGVLEQLSRYYELGGLARARAIEDFELDWPNIAAAHDWAETQLARNIELLGMVRRYSLAAEPLLQLRRPPRERMHWHVKALDPEGRAARLPAQQRTPAELVSIQFAYGMALADAGLFDEAIETLERARPLAEMGTVLNVRITAKLFSLHAARNGWESAQAEASHLLPHLIPLSPREPAIISPCRFVLANLDRHDGKLEQAEQQFQEARDAAAQARDVRLEFEALLGLAGVAADRSELGRAAALCEQALDFARTWKDERGVAQASWELGLIRARQGNLERAREWMQVLVDYRRTIGHTQAESTAREMEEHLRPGTSGRGTSPASSNTTGRTVAELRERYARPPEETQEPQRTGKTHHPQRASKALLDATEALVRQARALSVSAGQPGLEEQRSRLLEETQSPNLWDDPERAASTLRSFRTVEARLNELERLKERARFVRRLVREAKNEAELASAEKEMERVAHEVQMAEVLGAAGAMEHGDEALVDIRASETGEGQDAWVQELATMYLGWAERRGYEAMVVAEEEEPFRVVVRIAGPGAYGYLAGEAGLHRRIDEEKHQRAYVRVHRGELDETKDIASRVVKGQGGSNTTDEVRRYHMGRGARVEDPRTGVSTSRVEEVLRGGLDTFIAAWLPRSSAANSPDDT